MKERTLFAFLIITIIIDTFGLVTTINLIVETERDKQQVEFKHVSSSVQTTNPPIVEIFSPQNGSSYNFRDEQIVLIYNVSDDQNFTVEVFLNNISIGYKANGSILIEITCEGNYSLRIEATNEDDNIGIAVVFFTAYVLGGTEQKPNNTLTTTTTSESSHLNSNTAGIGIPFVILILVSMLIFRDERLG